MQWRATLARAGRGLRRERGLYLVVVSSLVAAFLCLGAALLAERNLAAMAVRWGEQARLTVYLVDGAAPEAVGALRERLAALPEAREVRLVTPEQARAEFLEQAGMEAAMGRHLPAELFPASVEVRLVAGTPVQRVTTIAERVARAPVVESVESYRGWMQRIEGLVGTVRTGALVVSLLVLLCVLAVVANTVRLVMAGRRREVEVMRLCGATEGYIGAPVLLEGALQGLAAAALSIVLLYVGFAMARESLEQGLTVLLGARVSFLAAWQVGALLLGGAALGALGGVASLRRALAVEG